MDRSSTPSPAPRVGAGPLERRGARAAASAPHALAGSAVAPFACTKVIVAMWTLHHDETIWGKPNEYDPDRFDDETR
eukprot:tig00020603_g11825.t1